MHGSCLDWAALAVALRQPVANIIAMAPPQCRPKWPQEMGLCLQCFAMESAAAGNATSWCRRWMHPLVTACEQHGVWLAPVSTRALRSVRHARDMIDLAAQASDSRQHPQPVADALIDDALWLQQLCIAPATRLPGWGSTPKWVLDRIIDSLARLMMADGSSNWARDRIGWTKDSLPVELGNWSAQASPSTTAAVRPRSSFFPTAYTSGNWCSAWSGTSCSNQLCRALLA